MSQYVAADVDGTVFVGKRRVKYNHFAHTINFTREQVSFIEEAAIARQKFKEQQIAGGVKIRDKRIIDRDDLETHYLGIMGEIAVATLVGLLPDLNTYLSSPLADLVLFGVPIEIKTLQGFLVFNTLEDFRGEVAALVTYTPGNKNACSVQGWITKKQFEEQHFIDNFGYGDRLCMQPTNLLPIQTLGTYCLMRDHLKAVMRVVNEGG